MAKFHFNRSLSLLVLSILLLFNQLSLAQSGPGGVGNGSGSSGQPRNVVWLRADFGVTQTGTVDAWADQSGNSLIATGTGATRPSFVASDLNFNSLPVINFANTGTNKHVVIADNDILDNTTGFSLFVVFRTATTAGNTSLLSKRTSAGVDQSYMTWINTAQLSSRAAGSTISGGTINTTTTYVASTVYNGTASTISSFLNGLTATSGAGPTSVPNNASNLFIGAFDVSGGETRNLNGSIAEVLVYTSTLNAAQRQIVENYLAAKYNLTITGDVYAGDASGFDFDVAGIGRNSATTHSEANSAGFVLSTYNSSIDTDGEFVIAGRASGSNSVVNCACGGFPGTIQQRWGRTWFVDKTTAGTLDATISFDFSEGVAGLFPQNKNDYELLYSSDGGLSFSIVTIPSADKSISGDKMVFRVPNASLLDGIYTLGTTNSTLSPVNGLANKTWYSYQSGNANDPLAWTLDSGITPLYVNPSSETPGAADNVVITSGKTITLVADNFAVNNLEVFGTLDLVQFSGHTTTSISGTGRIRLAGSTSNLDNFPSGTTTAFANATTGGTVEIYGTSTFSLNQIRQFNDLIINKSSGVVSLNANYTLNGDFTVDGGEFRFGSTASTLIVYGDIQVNPTTSVTVENANVRHQLDVYGDFTNNDGTVQFTNRVAVNYTAEATNGIVDFNLLNDTENQTVTCNGVTRFYRIEIDKGTDDTYLATFNANNPSNFLLFGYANDNDGAIAQLATSNNAFALLRGTAEIQDNIIITMLSDNGNYNISAGAQLWVNGGTVLNNGGNSTVPYGKLKISDGLLESRVNAGITTRDNGTIIVEGGVVITNQIRTSVLGTSNVGGYIQSGGSVTVDGDGPGGSGLDYYVFSLTYTGNVFQMSGGTLTVKGYRAGTASNRGAIFINSDPANTSVTGGTIIAEISNTNINRPGTLPANDSSAYVITSRAPFWNLVLRNTLGSTIQRQVDILGGTSGPAGGGAAEVTLPAQNLVVKGGLTIESKVKLDHNGKNLNIAGNLTIQSNADLLFSNNAARRNTTTLDGTDNATLTFLNRTQASAGDEQRFWNFVINKPSDKIVSLASGKTDLTGSNNNLLRIDGTSFKLLSGTLDQGSHSVRMYCDTVLNYQTVGVFSGAATGDGPVANDRNDMIKFRDDNTATTLLTTSNAIFGVVRLNSGDDPIALNSNLRIQFLQYLYGKINLSTYRLTLDQMVGALTGAAAPPNNDFADSLGLQLRRFSVEDMLATSGNASDGGLAIRISANGNYRFPLGIGTSADDNTNNPGTDKYTPAYVTVSGFADDGYIIINPVNEELQTTNLSGGADILDYYWRVRYEGFTTLPTVKYQFTYNIADVGGSEATYVPGKVLDINPFTRSSEAGTVNIAAGKKIIHFDGTGAGFTLEQANYTAGAATRFTGSPEIYYTKRGGDGFTLKWNNPANWTLAANGALPPHHSGQADATDFPQAGDIAIVGFVPFTDTDVARRGQPHGIAIDGITANIAELRFTQLLDVSNNPTARVYAYNFQFRPTVNLNNNGTQGQLINATVSGEGMFWIRSDGGNLSDPNFAGVDLGAFNLQDSAYVVYENTINGATYVNLPSTFPNLMMATNGWGSVNNSATISKDITVNGDLELLGDVNLLLSTGATGNITVNRNLRFFRSNANGNDSGDGSELRFGNTGTPRTVNILGNLILGNGNFGAGAVIRVGNPDGTPITHTINLHGSFIQNTGGNNTDVLPNGNGFKAGNNSANDRINLNLLGSTSMTLSNTAGDVPQLYSLTVNKGSSIATTASFDSNFTIDGPTNAAAKSLVLTNGLFIINTGAASVVLSSGGGDFSIPATAGLQVSAGTVSLTGSDTGLLLDGLLRVSGGTVDIDDAVGNGNNYIEYSASGNATIEVSSGSLTVGSQIRRSLTSTAGILKYRQTGGSVTVGRRAAPTSNRGVFEVVNNGSEFAHSGGATLTIVRGINSTTIPSVLITPETPVSLNSTSNIIIGTANTPAGANGQNIGISSNSSLGNVTLNNSSANSPRALIYSLPLTINGTFNINTGTSFNAQSFGLTLNENMVIDGTFTPSGNTTTFSATGAQAVSGAGTKNFFNLSKTNTGTLGLTSSINITNDLRVEEGILNDNGNAINLQGNAYFGLLPSTTGAHVSTGGGNGLVFMGSGQQQLFALRSDGIAELGVVTIDNTSNVIIPDNADKFTINNQLRLSRGVFDIGGSLLTLGINCSILDVNAFSVANMIQTNSSFTDNGVKKIFPIGHTSQFIFPIGQALYTPATFDFADLGAGSGAGTTSPSITVRPANEVQPIVQEDVESGLCISQIDDQNNVLQYHWIITAENATNFETNVVLQYQQSLVSTANGLTEADYLAARVRTSDATVFKFPDPTAVDETANTIHFSFNNVSTSEISGEYLAGVDCAIPNNIITYVTKGGGAGNGDITNSNIYVGNPSPLTLAGSVIQISVGDVVTIPSTTDNILLYRTEISGTLDIKSGSQGHRLGTVTGTGTLSFEVNAPEVSAVLPAGYYNDFFSCSGGELLFTGNTSYEILGGIPSLRRLTLTGTGNRNIGNNDITICEDLTVNGATLANTNNRDISIGRDALINSGTFLTGTGSILIDRNLVVAGGTFNGQTNGTKRVSNDLLVSAGTFSAGSGGTFTILRHLNYSGGTFTGGSGGHRTIFRGTVAQNTTGNFSLHRLQINNSLGLTLGGNVTINSELFLTNGNISTGATTFLIALAARSTPAEGRANSFVDGKLFKELGAGGAPTTSNTFIFPIGSGTQWRSASVSVASGTAATWDMQYFIGNADTQEASVTNMNFLAPIVRLAQNEYWKVSDGTVAATGRTATIGLSWGLESQVSANSVERQDLRVMQWNAAGPRWENRGGTNFSGGNTQSRGTFEASSTMSFSEQIVTLGSIDTSNPLPVTLVRFVAKIEGSVAHLNWVTASEINNDYFEVQRSMDGFEFTSIGKLDGQGTTNSTSRYFFEDPNLTMGKNYYRLKQVDFSGKTSFSKIISVYYDGETPLGLSLFPNPTHSRNINLKLINSNTDEVSIKIYDSTGKIHHEVTVTPEDINSSIELQSEDLKAGLYMVMVTQGTQRIIKRLIIKD